MEKVKPNLVLKNGSIYTVDKGNLWAEAIAIAGERIVFVGNNKDAEALDDSETEVIDLEGKMVLPGFIDAHSHPSHAMDLVGNINLYSQESLEKYKQTIKEFVESHADAKAFRGSGWNDALFPNNGPTKDILDALVPDRPISLVSYDGHSLWVNSVTLDRAKINKDTPSPDGGIVERDLETGEPNGTLRETASKLIDNVIPDYSLEERVNALLAYQEMANKAGVTMCHDAMLDEQSIAGYKALQEEGVLQTRFRGAIEIKPDSPVEEQIEMLLRERVRNSHPKFQTNTAKLFVDGVVEGGTAYLLEPYHHLPDFYGELIWDPQQLKEICAALDKEKIQIHIHVIGDAAARIALDALEYAQQLNGKRDARHLITHLQLVTPEDILRFAQLGVIGVPNPYWFKLDDYYWSLALPYLGKDRADHEYPMQSYLEAGVLMASGSDFPVTIPFDPLIGIETGITRSEIGVSNKEILWPEERVSLEAMIASFTINGATANFLEDEIGSLEVGKKADFIVFDQNLFQIPSTEIAKTKVLRTFIDGKEVFRAAG
jgi:hypothetical protein